MKKIALILLLVFSMLLTACAADSSVASVEPTQEITPQPTPAVMSEDEQRDMIESLRHVWAMDEDIYSVWSYTITDMDHNGRLELICATVQGTGHFTYADYYEISENFDGLKKLDMPISEGDSWIDITLSDADCYYDSANDIYYYVYESVTKVDAVTYGYSISAVNLSDGKVSHEILALKVENYKDYDTPPINTYSSPNGTDITEEKYNTAAEKRFTGMEKSTVSFDWITVDAYEPAASVTTSAAATTSQGSGPLITKNPTNETVSVGGKAWFIAHAQDAETISWHAINPSGTTMTLDDAMALNPGLVLEALPEDTLALRNVPLSFNGWSLQARFDGSSGHTYSSPAYVYVQDTLGAYNSVIQKYKDLHNNGITDMSSLIENGVSVMVGYAQSLGYALRDMDQDGIQELFILGNNPADPHGNMIYDLYTLINGQPVKVCESMERRICFLLNDNRVYFEGSSGAASQQYEFYVLQGGQLVFNEGFSTTNSSDMSGSAAYHTTQTTNEMGVVYANYDAFDYSGTRDDLYNHLSGIDSSKWFPELTIIY